MSRGFLGTKIGQRLLAILLAISLPALAFMGWLAIREGEFSVHDQTFAVLRAASDGAEAQIREFLLQLEMETIGLSRDKAIRQFLETSDLADDSARLGLARSLSADLAERQQEFPDVQEIFLVGPDGRVFASSVSAGVGCDVHAAEWFRRGCESFFPGDVAREGSRLTWVLAAPIRAQTDNRLLGVLACRVDPQTLSDLTTGRRVLSQGADTQCFRIGDSGETYIINRDGLMITESRFIRDAVLKQRVDTLPIQRARNEHSETAADYVDYRGVKVSGASMLLHNMGWVVLTEIDFSQAFLPLERLRNVLLYVTLGLGLGVILLAYHLARQVLRPICVLSQSDNALATGDESAAIVSEDGLPHDELGDLVRKRNTRIKDLFDKQKSLVHEQQQRAEAVNELARMSYSIMHDMRAPLRAIVGFGQLLEAEAGVQLTPASLNYLNRMRQAANRMDRLICDVLNYSQIVRGELPLGQVNPAELLREVIDTYPNLQRFKNSIHLPAESPLVLGNVAALTQCFSNLLDNAIRYSQPGLPPKIEIRFEQKNDWLRISVEDNGIGIPRGSEERIFDILPLGGNSLDGTGMGLAIVRKATERMGGRVGVSSEPGRGSRFWIELRSLESNGGEVGSVSEIVGNERTDQLMKLSSPSF